MAQTKPNSRVVQWLGTSLFFTWLALHKVLFRLPKEDVVELGFFGMDRFSGTRGRRLEREEEAVSNYRAVAPLQVGLCGECRHIKIGGPKKYQTCEYFIYSTARRRNVSLVEALTIEIEEYGREECETCYAEHCDEHARLYWRYTDAAPTILNATSSYLTSIHESWRIPSHILGKGIVPQERLEDFFSHQLNVHPLRHYVFEYNPSIIKLPPSQIPEIAAEETPIYLASYRVSTQQNCVPPNITLQMIGGNWTTRPKPRDYLALALLRSDLSIITEVVLHVVRLQDVRLFRFQDDQIYVGSYCQLVPIWLNQPDSMEGKRLLKNAFKSDLKIVMGKNSTWCSSYWKDLDAAKNLNYFVDAENNTVVEMNPLGPHMVQKVDLSGQQAGPHPDNATVATHVPRPSFRTLEELDLPYRHDYFDSPFTSDRGGACCVPFKDPRRRSLGKSKKLLLGVAHVKTPHQRERLKGIVKGNQYLSRFYAFEPKAPYKMVAVSGFFCLPTNPNSNGVFGKSRRNPYDDLPLWSPLEIAGRSYDDCPSIHFISGMTEKADDPSTLIIAYGVNDCTSWFIEVSKSEVIWLLFNPPKTIEAQA